MRFSLLDGFNIIFARVRHSKYGILKAQRPSIRSKMVPKPVWNHFGTISRSLYRVYFCNIQGVFGHFQDLSCKLSNSGNISILTNLTFLELKLNNDLEWVFGKTVGSALVHRRPPADCDLPLSGNEHKKHIRTELHISDFVRVQS